MDSKKARKLARSKPFIPGIFNYCDRWCERCDFTGRCMVYAMEEQQDRQCSRRSLRGDDYWVDVQKSLHLAIQLLKEMAAERGIDLDGAASDEELTAIERKDEDMRKHPLVARAAEYEKRVEHWLDAHREALEGKQAQLQAVHEAGLPGRNPIREAEEIHDAFEVIGWYQYQIGIKLMRALCTEPELDEDAAADDSAGSAKVSLIAIDRSLVAWTRIREHFQDEDDQILDTLVLLDRLRRAIEQHFPNARRFKRPGFDQ